MKPAIIIRIGSGKAGGVIQNVSLQSQPIATNKQRPQVNQTWHAIRLGPQAAQPYTCPVSMQ